ncbi:peptidase [Massilia sp. Dwa41.01b]|uniref:PA domain-containing protein n=1 Tax=Massilia sp. Dwa41.01b TaxID=2709302 RepID=UPI001603D27B|nr:PA domain-containing protein [Massilia sp. Dwa41.01b]QNA88605.1 peptidase [Massilia sp. Dwa41.01b]
MMFAKSFTTPLRRLATLLLSCAAVASAQAATITIVNQNAPGVGFNDPTPVTPVGGNPGTTLGQQRLLAFQHAADIWGATLTSKVPIRIGASFVPLSCTENSAVLGSAGANEIWSDFTNAPRPGTWYPSALASKLAGTDVSTPGEPHIIARFNSRLGLFPDCLPGPGFYLGFDRNAGAAIDLVTVLLHEMAHGLGFQTFTDDETGAEILGVPSIWDYYLVDNRTERPWVDMTDAERVASAISGNGLSWNGPIVTAAVPQVLDPRSRLTVGGSAAGGAAGNYDVGDASFGPPLGATPVTGQLMPVVEAANALGQACTPLDALNALAVRGNIALVSRGTCPFVDKARNVQAAGAIGMVVADNAPGDPTGMSGADPSITIPSVRVTQAAGASLLGALQSRSRTRSGVVASLGIDPARLAGTDTRRRILMYTPTVNAPGSSVSHYTTEAKPNQLMEPSINSDLTHEVTPPRDLTYPLLQDIGW